MKVLVLSPYPELLYPALDHSNDTHIHSTDAPERWPRDCDYIVSFGYRHIIGQQYIDFFSGRILNIHMSLLPWNRGADPNFWSWFDDTPKGITIHHINSGIDKGGILAQRQINKWQPGETLASSWYWLLSQSKELFEECWPLIKGGDIIPTPPLGRGSYHKSADKEQWMALLPFKWDTPVDEVVELGKSYRQVYEQKEDSGSGVR